MRVRRSHERGEVHKGWVRSLHTFSFGRYDDPAHRGFRSLIVLNEDWIAPGHGFERHAHSDTEIVTCVLAGPLLHEDSLGGRHVLGPGEVMATTTGRGLAHSESNASASELVHLLQIWLLPLRKRRPPTCAHRHFGDEEKRARLCLLVSRDARDGSLALGQDVDLFAALLGRGEVVEHALPGRCAWVHVVRGGSIRLNGVALRAGDAAALEGEPAARLEGEDGMTEVLLFDLA
jgi:hypothetical protein